MKKIIVSSFAVITMFSFSASGVFAVWDISCPGGLVTVEKETVTTFNVPKYAACMLTLKKHRLCQTLATSSETIEHEKCTPQTELNLA